MSTSKRAAAAHSTRSGLSPWLLLVLTDLVALATIARCFSGAGELVVALPICLAVHLLTGGGRRLADRSSHRVAVTTASWVLAVLAAFLLPIAAVDGHALFFGLPLSASWQLAGKQLSQALSIFSNKVAPVAEVPGLVLVTGWAAGAIALAAEILYSDAGLPAVLALVPAFDVVVFTGTLGTATGRAVEIAAVAGLGLGFLVLAQAEGARSRTVLMARAGSVAAEPVPAGRSASRWRLLPGVTIVAALAAGVIGPVLPGATSAPLIAWHGEPAGRPNGQAAAFEFGGGRPNTVAVSDLVQVAEQEVDNSSSLLFIVHSAVRTRETLLTLDDFDGNSWNRIKQGTSSQSLAVPQFAGSVSALQRNPPSPHLFADGSETVDQVIQIENLGGRWLPSPGVTDGVDGDGGVSQVGAGGPLVAPAALTDQLTYAVKAEIPPASAAALSSESAFGTPVPLKEDLQLPTPVPSDLARLAKSIAGTAISQYTKAKELQDYFLYDHGFTYRLPRATPKGAIADTSQSYAALQAFLFRSRVGYCQQYATAFAVLARILGLPTRIAVGFLPGKETGPHKYEVTGADVHAWPEVYLAQYGWVTFEPTPGVPATSDPAGLLPPSGVVIHVSSSPTTLPRLPAHNFGHVSPALGNGGAPTAHRHRVAQAPRQLGNTGVLDVALVLLGLGLAWVVAVPLWRFGRHRRDRKNGRRATLAAWRSTTWTLAAANAHRRRAETHLEFVERVRQIGLLSEGANQALEALARQMDKTMYGRESGEEAPDAAAAWAEATQVQRSARRRISWWQRAFLLVDPRDLLAQK